jgi:GNAT superfamily N-acetyltransferase
MRVKAIYPVWEALHPTEVAAVYLIAQRVHLELPERIEVFAERIRLFPEGCRKIVHAGRIAGYGLAHPWMFDAPPSLDAFLGKLPIQPDCLHLHDAVVLPGLRGHGAGSAYIEEMAAVARAHDFARLTLVSVYGTNRLWARCGFTVRHAPALTAKLAVYGPSAHYMVRPV